MSRVLSRIVAAVIGVSLVAAGLIGMSAAQRGRGETSADEGLELDVYCRDLYGEEATAERLAGPVDWRCSAWRNGVWGLDPLDLDAACSSQHGDGSRHDPSGGDPDDPTCQLPD